MLVIYIVVVFGFGIEKQHDKVIIAIKISIRKKLMERDNLVNLTGDGRIV